MFNINNSDENSNNIEMKNPEIIESYNSKNNYFYLINNIIKIQSLYRQHLSIKKVTKLKSSLKLQPPSENKNSNNINNSTNITSNIKEPSLINKKSNNVNNDFVQSQVLYLLIFLKTQT